MRCLALTPKFKKTLKDLSILTNDHPQDIKNISQNTNTLIEGFKEQLKFNSKQEVQIPNLQNQVQALNEKSKTLEKNPNHLGT